jgi:hypothetical protein
MRSFTMASLVRWLLIVTTILGAPRVVASGFYGLTVIADSRAQGGSLQGNFVSLNDAGTATWSTSLNLGTGNGFLSAIYVGDGVSSVQVVSATSGSSNAF